VMKILQDDIRDDLHLRMKQWKGIESCIILLRYHIMVYALLDLRMTKRN
jgi:hypothetical protein